MSKAIMLSIRPKWCEKIVNGNKTIEVRKTRPKMNTPFECYIYCTIGGAGLKYSDFSGTAYARLSGNRLDEIIELPAWER